MLTWAPLGALVALLATGCVSTGFDNSAHAKWETRHWAHPGIRPWPLVLWVYGDVKDPTGDRPIERFARTLEEELVELGKVPTSAALVLREAGVASLSALRAKVLRSTRDPQERARLLEGHLSRGWRISDKIASMF